MPSPLRLWKNTNPISATITCLTQDVTPTLSRTYVENESRVLFTGIQRQFYKCVAETPTTWFCEAAWSGTILHKGE